MQYPQQFIQALISTVYLPADFEAIAVGEEQFCEKLQELYPQKSAALLEGELLVKYGYWKLEKLPEDYLLWRELRQLMVWKEEVELNHPERAFLEASWAYRRRRRRVVFWYWLGLAVLGLLMLSWSFWPKGDTGEEEAPLGAQQILDQISCFGEDCLILVVRKDQDGELRYGFIDKSGRERIPHQYTEADPFDEYGYARVKIANRLYLIDSNNRRLPLAENIKALTDSTKALSLNEQLLDSLAAEIFEHSNLEVLYLRGNQLEEIPKEIAKLPLLKVLDLGFNEISNLPVEIAELPFLEILDLQNNKLTAFPMALTEMEALEDLDLSENQIPSIPKGISKMKSLKKLNLANNQLTEIDTAVIQLENLEELNVYGNEITFVPNSVLNMDLKVLNVGGNRLSKQEEKKVFQYIYNEESSPKNKGTLKNNEKGNRTSVKLFGKKEELENFSSNPDDLDEFADCRQFWKDSKKVVANDLKTKMFPLSRKGNYRYQMSLVYSPSHRLSNQRFYLKLMFQEELKPNKKTNIYLFGHDEKKLPCRLGKIDISADEETYTVRLYPELLPHDTSAKIQHPLDWLASEELYSIEVEYELSEGVKKSFNRAIRTSSAQLIQKVVDCMLITTGQKGLGQEAKCRDYFERRVDSLGIPLLRTKPLTLVQNPKFVVQMKIFEEKQITNLRIQTNFDQIFEKGDVMVFEFQNGGRKAFVFEKPHELIMINGKYGSQNQFVLSEEDRLLFLDSRVIDIKIMKTDSRRVYPLSVTYSYARKIIKIFGCYLEELE